MKTIKELNKLNKILGGLGEFWSGNHKALMDVLELIEELDKQITCEPDTNLFELWEELKARISG